MDAASGVSGEKAVAFSPNEDMPESVPPEATEAPRDVNEDVPEFYLQQNFRDHFTLDAPSSLVRFRSNQAAAARVFEHGSTQFILEEKIDEVTKSRRIVVKQLSEATNGLHALRGIYTCIAVFWSGILFVLSVQLLMIMVLETAITAGTTEISKDLNVFQLVGVVFGLLSLSNAFALGLVLAGAFIKDIWNGHSLMKLFWFKDGNNGVFVDWLFFTMFALIPLFVMCITLLAKSDKWWTITLLFWYCSVSVNFCIFAACSVYIELKGTISFISKRADMAGKGILEKVKESILFKQRNSYSGSRKVSYLIQSSKLPTDDGETEEEHIIEWSKEEHTSLWSRVTTWDFLSTASKRGIPFFEKLPTAESLFTIDDLQDYRPYLTKYTWSLERLFCRPRNSRYVVLIKGPGALTDRQMKSSIACSILGLFATLFVILSILVWLELGTGVNAALMILCLIIAYPSMKDIRRLIKAGRMVEQARSEMKEGDIATPEDRGSSALSIQSTKRLSETTLEESEGMVLVSEKERITRASDLCCWSTMVVEIVLFFFYPIVVLFLLGNVRLALLFLLVTFVSKVRNYVNLIAVIEETGNLFPREGATARAKWAYQSKLNDLISTISYNKARAIWRNLLLGSGLLWVLILVASVDDPAAQGGTNAQRLTFIPSFSYTALPDDVRYPSCQLSETGPFRSTTTNPTMADFVFLVSLPYKTDDVVTGELEDWFYADNVVEDRDTIEKFRKETDNVKSPVVFRLFRYGLEDESSRGIISVRGTQSNWDMLADVQLWSAAILIQVLRAGLPFGELWTPFLDEIIMVINGFQAGPVEQVAFYKVIREFADYLKDDPTYSDVQVSGHSLGGGLAMIAGAQSGVPAVALSGPNSVLSGRSFEPKVTPDDLDRYTFNIVPDRDIVPMFDDLAQNYQNIRCEADLNDPIGCHDYTLALCEVIYTCGSFNRPVICECVEKFHYPEPQASDSNETRSFAEVCQERRAEIEAEESGN